MSLNSPGPNVVFAQNLRFILDLPEMNFGNRKSKAANPDEHRVDSFLRLLRAGRGAPRANFPRYRTDAFRRE